jgi:hypothetical protein
MQADAAKIQRANELIDELIREATQTKRPVFELFDLLVKLVIKQRVPQEVCLRLWMELEKLPDVKNASLTHPDMNFSLLFRGKNALSPRYHRLIITIGTYWLEKTVHWTDVLTIIAEGPAALEDAIIQKLATMQLEGEAVYSLMITAGGMLRLKTYLAERLVGLQPNVSAEELQEILCRNGIEPRLRECAARLLLLRAWRSRSRGESSRCRAFWERLKASVWGPTREDLLLIMERVPSLRKQVWPKLLDSKPSWEQLLVIMERIDDDWRSVILNRLLSVRLNFKQCLRIRAYAPKEALGALRRIKLTDEEIGALLCHNDQDIRQHAWHIALNRIDQPPFTWQYLLNVFRDLNDPTLAKDLLELAKNSRRLVPLMTCLECFINEPELAAEALFHVILTISPLDSETMKLLARLAERFRDQVYVQAKIEAWLTDPRMPGFIKQNLLTFKAALDDLRCPRPEDNFTAKGRALIELFNQGREQ